MDATDQKRSADNRDGDARGCASCPVCGDSAWWKQFHRTVHFEGTIELTHCDRPPGTPCGKTHEGDKGVSVLCQDCWNHLTPEQRLPYYDALFDKRVKAIRLPLRNTNSKGEQFDVPADRERYDRQKAELEIEHEQIRQAVLAGK